MPAMDLEDIRRQIAYSQRHRRTSSLTSSQNNEADRCQFQPQLRKIAEDRICSPFPARPVPEHSSMTSLRRRAPSPIPRAADKAHSEVVTPMRFLPERPSAPRPATSRGRARVKAPQAAPARRPVHLPPVTMGNSYVLKVHGENSSFDAFSKKTVLPPIRKSSADQDVVQDVQDVVPTTPSKLDGPKNLREAALPPKPPSSRRKRKTRGHEGSRVDRPPKSPKPSTIHRKDREGQEDTRVVARPPKAPQPPSIRRKKEKEAQEQRCIVTRPPTPPQTPRVSVGEVVSEEIHVPMPPSLPRPVTARGRAVKGVSSVPRLNRRSVNLPPVVRDNKYVLKVHDADWSSPATKSDSALNINYSVLPPIQPGMGLGAQASRMRKGTSQKSRVT